MNAALSSDRKKLLMEEMKLQQRQTESASCDLKHSEQLNLKQDYDLTPAHTP